MPPARTPYYSHDLATVHHKGFAFLAEACAPGVLALLEPVRSRGGVVLEIGCGSGLLTAALLQGGHRVIATDTSPDMLALARSHCPEADLRRLTLPADDVPPADAIVGVGHALNYLDEEADLMVALRSLVRALRPNGLLAVDLCDLEWGTARRDPTSVGRVGKDWAIITRSSVPAANRFVREMTTFVQNADGSWRRDDERHDNVLLDTEHLPDLLAEEGLEAEIRSSFGTEELPVGLRVLVGTRRDAAVPNKAAPQ